MTAKPTNTKTDAYVIDASAIVKLFSHEEGSVAVRKLFQQSELGTVLLRAPDLLLYEVGNVLGKSKKLPRGEVVAGITLLQNSQIIFSPLDAIIISYTALFMEKYNLTFYDAAYGALAHTENVPLISANPKDHGKIREITVKALGLS